jgi:small subunit ribosomal protein S1
MDFDSFDMGSLLGAGPKTGLPAPGDLVEGRVSRVTGDTVYVEMGARAEGFVPRKELPDAKPGDAVKAFVVDVDDLGVQLSIRLSGEAASRFLDDAKERGLPVEGRVESRSSGGYTVRVGAVRAFCPRSQIARLPLAEEDAVLGQTLAFLVIETGEKVVVSRRALEEKDLEERREKTKLSLAEGQIVEAVVTSVQAWGAFLDHDGVELLLPRREASWEEIPDLTTRFERGQRLQVRLLGLDPERGRYTVSARDPGLDPWVTASTRVPPGKVVSGRVTGQTDFGIFVEVAPGLQGLVHRSRLAKLPSVGSTLEVRVLSIDSERRRLELAPSDFDPEAQAANTVGVEVTGEVVEVRDRGVAVRLQDGRSAWLPAHEVELTPGTLLAQRFRSGHPVTARIVSDDGGRVTLSMRTRDTEDDWRAAMKQQAGGGTMGTLGDLLSKARKR